MDGIHLPEIVQLRERSGRCISSVSKNITACEGLALTGRRQTSTRETRRSIDVEKSTRKKRTNTNNREHKMSSKKASNSGKNLQGRSQSTRKRFETIGLPKITTNDEENTFKTQDNCVAKKPKRTKPDKGDTISYVYSKSLRDENSMAFLRNSVDFEKDFNTSYKIKDKRSSFDKKPYGLPALKLNEELINEREQFLNKEVEFSDGSFEETESLLNAWEAIDDDASNGTTYDSTDCSTGNEAEAL